MTQDIEAFIKNLITNHENTLDDKFAQLLKGIKNDDLIEAKIGLTLPLFLSLPLEALGVKVEVKYNIKKHFKQLFKGFFDEEIIKIDAINQNPPQLPPPPHMI